MKKTTLSTTRKLIKNAKREINRVKKITLKKLSRFKQSGQLITVSSMALGEGQFISKVEDIYTSGEEEIVVLKWFDRNNFAYLTHLLIEELLLITPRPKSGSVVY